MRLQNAQLLEREICHNQCSSPLRQQDQFINRQTCNNSRGIVPETAAACLSYKNCTDHVPH